MAVKLLQFEMEKQSKQVQDKKEEFQLETKIAQGNAEEAAIIQVDGGETGQLTPAPPSTFASNAPSLMLQPHYHSTSTCS